MVGRPDAVGLGHRDGLVVGRGLGQTDVLANLGNTFQKRIPERLLRWTAAGVLPSGSRPDDLFGATLPSVGPAAPVRYVGVPPASQLGRGDAIPSGIPQSGVEPRPNWEVDRGRHDVCGYAAIPPFPSEQFSHSPTRQGQGPCSGRLR
jgi:hypothetical protein